MRVRVSWTLDRRRAVVEIGLLASIGLLLAITGPYRTGAIPWLTRFVYWQVCIVGGGLIGVAISAAIRDWIRSSWRHVLATAGLMTPLVTLLVMVTGKLVGAQATGLSEYLSLLWQVFAIALPIMAVRALVWRRQPVLIQTQTIIQPPLPAAEAAFRQRLSAKRRTARLIAVEAHDHYLRVHTDAGCELLTLRFTDALVDLATAHGYQIHRSWWVAADAIEGVKWRRGTGQVQLSGQLVAPVSRSHASTLRFAGWL